MRLLSLVPLLFLAATSLLAAASSPSAELAAQGRATRMLAERYDFTAMTDFLLSTTLEHPEVAGTPLGPATITNGWEIIQLEPVAKIRNGDWVLWDNTPKEGEFILAYSLADGRSVDIHAKRKPRKRFELLNLSRGAHFTAQRERLPEIDLTGKNPLDPSQIYVTKEAAAHLESLRSRLPTDIKLAESTDRKVVEPKARVQPMPNLPRALRLKPLNIKFVVAMIISPAGFVDHAWIISSSEPAANDAMVARMKDWIYHPGTVGGQRAPFLVVTEYSITSG